MAIEAILESERSEEDGRSASRRKLQLNAPGKTGAGLATRVVIHDISESGLLLQTSARLAVGEKIEVMLPHSGAAKAKVVWKSGALRGCEFERRISQAGLSAAQLQSQPAALSVASDETAAAEPLPALDETFGARIRRLRMERKISLIGFARMLGVSKPTVWKWERDEVRPRRKSIDLAASVLGVSERELVFGDRDTPALTTDGDPKSAHQLSDVISACKERIADAAGTEAANVSVTIKL